MKLVIADRFYHRLAGKSHLLRRKWRKRISEVRFEEHRELLEPLIAAVAELGLQRDIREFFGTCKAACDQADGLLFQAGRAEAIDEACKRSRIGKLLPNALYVHRSAVESLEPLLRVYEGCARAYLGEIEDTNLVELHRFAEAGPQAVGVDGDSVAVGTEAGEGEGKAPTRSVGLHWARSPKVSYLSYPDFETDPHPALARSVKLNLRTRELDCWDYSSSDNPPVLHRKETFLLADHPLREKFARLTRQEEQHGLLDETATIGTRNGWNARLAELGFELRGHRLVRRKEPMA